MPGLLNESLARHYIQERLRDADGRRRCGGARLELDDGRSVCVRQLRAEDRGLYSDAVAGLSPRSRYLRFAAPVGRISESLLDQMMDFEGDRHVGYAALTQDGRTIIGVARFVRAASDPHSAEIAIAIADEWQGHGLGSALLARVVEHARGAGLRRLIATTLSENRAAARLVRRLGFSLAGRSGVQTDYELTLHRHRRHDARRAAYGSEPGG